VYKYLSIVLIILLLGLSFGLYFLLVENNKLSSSIYSISYDYNKLASDYSDLENNFNDLKTNFQEFQDAIMYTSNDNFTTVSVLYQTNFGENQQIISLSVPYDTYYSYHNRRHPSWNINLEYARDYITPNEPIIVKIVETVDNLTQGEEDMANSLLNLVQDKMYGLNIRYYPTTELKYPVETLVEMGGDCDAHSILYATLLKSAGIEVVLLISNEILSDGFHHVAIGVQLENPPEHSLSEFDDLVLTYNGKNYYYAETTNAYWRVGDLPPKFQNLTFQILPL
jgi:hypothetical protein